MAAPTLPTVRTVLFSLEEAVVPWQTVAHWQWAWRPQGPVLGPRHTARVLRTALHDWDRRRWAVVTGQAPAPSAEEYREHLATTLTRVAGHSLPAAEGAAVVDRFLRPAAAYEPYRDLPRALAALRASGRTVRLVSTVPGVDAVAWMRWAGLPAELLLRPAPADGPPLPHPKAYRRLVEELAVERAETVWVGALYWSDVRAAGRADLRALLLDRLEAWPDVGAVRLATPESLPGLLDRLPAEPVASPSPVAEPGAPEGGAGGAQG